MKRIHIIGSSPRSGTTLLAEVMKTCFKIDNYCEHEAPICKQLPRNGEIFLTKQPREIGAVRFPLKFNPELYVICVVRDPRDSIVSKHSGAVNEYYCSLKFWKYFVKNYHKNKNNSRFITIKYEDLVSYPNKIQEEIQSRLPFLEKYCNFSEYHLNANVSVASNKAMNNLRPIEPKGIGNWQSHLLRIKQQTSIHGDIENDLIYFGYESDAYWKNKIHELPFHYYSSVTGEDFNYKFYYHINKKQFFEVTNIILRKLNFNPKIIADILKRLRLINYSKML